MTPELIQAFVQLGFAAGIATWLVYFLTNSLRRGIDSLIKTALTTQLLILENQRLLMQMEARLIGVTLGTGEKGMSEVHAMAAASYRQATERLQTLEDTIKQSMQGIR